MKVELRPNNVEATFLHKNGFYALLSNDLAYIVNDMPITVPKGFITDFASVPRLFWFIYSPIGPWSVGAILHDYIYSIECELNIHRKLADDMFYAVMRDCGTSKFTAYIMYLSVRLFGKSSWKVA